MPEKPDTGSSTESPWLRVKEACVFARCSAKAIYAAVSKKDLRASRIGARKLVIHRQWLDEYLEKRSKPTDL